MCDDAGAVRSINIIDIGRPIPWNFKQAFENFDSPSLTSECVNRTAVHESIHAAPTRFEEMCGTGT